MNSIVRIIPRLDIKGSNLVKGIHLEGLRTLGKPELMAKYYYNQGADELIYMDVVASLYNRDSLLNLITTTAKEIFVPLTVGGGIRSVNDIRKVLRAGADKVVLNTAAIKNPHLIKEASSIFGSSTIAISIEAQKEPDGRYLAYTDNGRQFTGIEVISWAKDVESLGAGEIILTSIDKEGTGEGFDLDLIKLVANKVTIPIIASGGAGKLSHVKEALDCGVNAVALASMLHYFAIKDSKTKAEKFNEGNLEFLKTGHTFIKVNACSIKEIKRYLFVNNIPYRKV
ncbi:MAG: imidazole glycerol phosphate synthase cyclase subunit [Actinobacteria bacterium]|nr:imidazole glycerol phosphate synthase cyclase subunit [Actinomycetota bacterium]